MSEFSFCKDYRKMKLFSQISEDYFFKKLYRALSIIHSNLFFEIIKEKRN